MAKFAPGFALQELIQHIADFTNDAIVVAEAEPVDEPGPRIVYVNPAFTEMTGYSPDEVLQKSPRMLQGEGTSLQTKHRIREAFRLWQPVRAELLNYRKDGSTFWVELSIVPVADTNGWYRYWVAVQRDVTERRQMDQHRQLQEQIMQALDEGIVVANALLPDHPIEYVNGCVTQLTGYTREEFIGKNCRLLQGPGTDRAAVERLREGIKARRTVTTEILNYRKDGSSFLNLVTVSPMCDDHGHVIKLIGVQRDITELHEREQQMVIAQRVKAVGELAGGIAHDFNNLLTSILGATDLLAERVSRTPELALLAETIRSAALRGSSQVQRLMSLTRTPTLNRCAVDMQRLMTQLQQLLVRSLRDSIVLTLEMDANARWVDAEPVQLESAVLNLVINAQDAMTAGGRIHISTQRVLDDGQDWVAVRVEDAGEGMSAEVMHRIFDPFFTTKEPGHGSGLGLSMVHAYVTQMGGHVKVQSEPGLGTSFTLYFQPAKIAPAEDAQPPHATNVQVHGELCAGEKIVLLVEDDAVVRLTTAAMLERLGYQVIEAEDAAQALEVLESPDPIDLLFTDLLMPGGMNGRELCERAYVLRPELMQLQTSGWADSTLDLAQPTREIPFIAKPYTLEQLSSMLQEMFNQAPHRVV